MGQERQDSETSADYSTRDEHGEAADVGRRAYRLMSWWWVPAAICALILADDVASGDDLTIAAAVGLAASAVVGYLRG